MRSYAGFLVVPFCEPLCFYSGDDFGDAYSPDIGLGGPTCQPTVFFCALNAILALGCEFSDLPSDEKAATALAYTERMKDLLQIPILDGGNLAYVQSLAPCRPTLALHTIPVSMLECGRPGVSNGTWAGATFRERKREWDNIGNGNQAQSVVWLRSNGYVPGRIFWSSSVHKSRHLSMTLGRPPPLHNLNVLPLPRPMDDVYLVPGTRACEQPEGRTAITAFNVENLKLAKLLGSILENIYHPASSQSGPWLNGDPAPSAVHRDISTIMHMDSCLKQLADNLPDAFRWGSSPSILSGTDSVIQRQRNVLQARFIHLKVLLHRPSFSAHRF